MAERHVNVGDFPGSPVLKTPHFHGRRPFDPWWGEVGSPVAPGAAKNVLFCFLKSKRGPGKYFIGCPEGMVVGWMWIMDA